MGISNLITLLSGVALFLFGMSVMGDGLKKVAGNKMEIILFRLTGTPLKGMLLGTVVTAIVQSSSAVSVMVVGFVNSGIMLLSHAIPVILGAIVGTSVTGWILCLSELSGSGLFTFFSADTLAALAAVIGIVCRMFSKNRSRQHFGNILLGFAVLMFGMQMMSGAVSPLRDSPLLLSLLTAFSNPALGFLVGLLLTAVIQSASAAVGILQALTMTGAVSMAVAFPLILGIAVGACIPVLLSSFGANVSARRTAFSYLLVAVLGSLLAALVYYLIILPAAPALHSVIMSPVSTAAVNSLFRIFAALLLLPLTCVIEKLLNILVKKSRREIEAGRRMSRLDERFLGNPSLAIEQSRLTAEDMALLADSNLNTSLELFESFSEEKERTVGENEQILDEYEDKIGSYLIRLNASELSAEQNRTETKILHVLSDFERIGDHAQNLAELARERHEKSVYFSGEAYSEMNTLVAAVREICSVAVKAYIDNDDELALRVEPLEDCIDMMTDEMKIRHTNRVQAGTCTLLNGFIFNDFISNLERVADHCSNIALAVIEFRKGEFDAHSYILELQEHRPDSYNEYLEFYSEKYKI